MFKFTFLALIVTFLFVTGCQKSTGPISQEGNQFMALFNGNNLDGWHMTGKSVASVEKGILTLATDSSGNGGWFLTSKSFKNFHLTAEYLCPYPNNSGITFRYNEKTGGNPTISAYEVNLYNTSGAKNPTGSIVDLARSFWADTLKPDAWHKIEIIARGDCLVSVLDGMNMVTTHQRRAFEGKIGLQARSGKGNYVKYRNVQVKELPQAAPGPQIEDYMRHEDIIDFDTISVADFSAWDTVGDARWMVEDDHILGISRHVDFSFLRTKKSYKNFYLKLKFRIAKDNNSGVFIRQDPDAKEIGLESGMEINIYDHDGDSYGWPTGSNVTRARAYIGLIDYKDWNTMEIFAFNRHICIYVNGVKASEYYTDEKFNRPGNICLQVGERVASPERGDSEVRFKEVRIRDFSGVPFIGY